MAANVMVDVSLEEIQNMKVTDLRKKLKEFGLPATGNKNELIERLQEVCFPSKGDSFDSNFNESQISGLLDVDDSIATMEDSELLDKVQLPHIDPASEEAAKALPVPVIEPRKKISFIQMGSENIAVPKKKILLNRTNVVHDTDSTAAIEPKPIQLVQPLVSHNKLLSDQGETVDKKVSTLKNMSAAERLAMRAKRFNMNGTNMIVTNKNSAGTVVTKNSNISNKNSKQSILSSAITPELDVLRKRSQRFGQSVSNVMKQLEEKEKVLKRKCKFGASIAAAASIDDQEKKKRRAERFAIS